MSQPSQLCCSLWCCSPNANGSSASVLVHGYNIMVEGLMAPLICACEYTRTLMRAHAHTHTFVSLIILLQLLYCPLDVHSAGTAIWPGANFVVHPDGEKTFLKFGDRRKIAADLKVFFSSSCVRTNTPHEKQSHVRGAIALPA
eukprot:1160784-Pelagomonas_calceolata.AAC.8